MCWVEHWVPPERNCQEIRPQPLGAGKWKSSGGAGGAWGVVWVGSGTHVEQGNRAKNWRDSIYCLTEQNSAQCVLCKVYFSAQPNKVKPILKFQKYWKILNIYLSQLVRVRGKYTFFSFSDFQTLDSWFPPKYVTVSTPSSLIMALYPPLLLIVSDTGS